MPNTFYSGDQKTKVKTKDLTGRNSTLLPQRQLPEIIGKKYVSVYLLRLFTQCNYTCETI